MDDDDLFPDAFSSEKLWKSSVFFSDPTTPEVSLFGPLKLDVPSIKLQHPYAPKDFLEHELRLPEIDTFAFGPLPDLPSLDESTLSVETPALEPEEDAWRIALEEGPANKDVEFFTWEAFETPGYQEQRTSYITECGPKAFDAALAKDDEKIPSGRIVKSNVLLDSLFNLGLGRSSVLFNFNTKLKSFVPAIRDGRASGTSLSSSQSLVDQFILTGNTCLYLRSFVERTFGLATSIPARVALATCVSSILSTIENHVGTRVDDIASVLQLQDLFAHPHRILTHIARLVDAVKVAKTNEQLSSILYHRVLEMEEGDAILRQLSIQTLIRVAAPTLELLSEWIGLRKEEQLLPPDERYSFIMLEDRADSQQSLEYSYASQNMPHFIAPEDGDTVFGTGNSLRFLKSHHPEHPLASTEKLQLDRPLLEWKFEWADIESTSAKATDYEENLRKAILDIGVHSHKSIHADTSIDLVEDMPAGQRSQQEFARYIEESAKVFDASPDSGLDKLPDDLQSITQQLLTGRIPDDDLEQSMSKPPIALTSMLSFRPLLMAQAKLVNATTLRLFFQSHQLRMHLSLQRQYHLFGDGVFSSRLSTALFDPEREMAERRKGTMRSGYQMGLQVGARVTWPPASSELRLALTGVLSESFYSSQLYYATLAGDDLASPSNKEGSELPGQLNFAVRQLTEPEMEKIMDPDSLYALDFLRLQYVAPSPLNLVITSSSLDKYDYIFRFLLRLLRMLFVVSHLPREYNNPTSRKFRIEAHHFITALSSYIFQTGIAEPWDAFSVYISDIEARLADEDAARELGTRVTEGLEALKLAHDKCLDSILFALLLRRRQKKVMLLLEEIFEHILLFAKMHKARGGQYVGGDAAILEKREAGETIRELYAKMKGKIKVFISVCRGLTGKRGYGKGRGTSEENTIERLLVLLEMNGYHAG